MNEIHQAFKIGALQLSAGQAYGTLHRDYGILQPDWELLTQDRYWSPDQARRIRSILASIIEVSLSIAGMPAVPLPGQYAAAVIATIVQPANRIVACMKVPDTFDAVAASGLHASFEVRPMRPEQMIALVMAYSGGLGGEPSADRLPAEVSEIMKKGSAA